MLTMADYRGVRAGRWKLTILSAQWSPELQERILSLVEAEPQNRHPRTIVLDKLEGTEMPSAYLKIFSPAGGIASVKDTVRESKAARFLRQGLALSASGFRAPLTIGIGEWRHWRCLRRSFVVTAAVRGQPLIDYLRERWAGEKPRPSFSEKKNALRLLGELIGKFHRLGYVHGDLVPSNILISERGGHAAEFYFMDNDRTRRYPPWLPQRLWRRNLVQLNRFPLAGISLQDRMRFLRAYLGKPRWGAKEERLSKWLENKTRKRRQECDRIADPVDFRELMRWNGPFAKRAG